MEKFTKSKMLLLAFSITVIFIYIFEGKNQFHRELVTAKLDDTGERITELPKLNDGFIEPNVGAQLKLIILTYMRSGSTLTGDILQQSYDVFYMYEPLWYTERMWLNLTTTKYLMFLNRTIVPFSYDEDFVMKRKLQILESVLNCNFMDLDLGTLTQYHILNSLSTRIYALCTHNPTDMTSLKQCIQVIQNDCKSSKVVVIKVIRSSMLDMQQLMRTEPNLKVLHLLRDPRGTLKSQYLVGSFSWSNLSLNANHHCRTLSRDIEISQFISAEFPGRIFTLRYEDLAETPIQTAQKLYRFMNLNLTDDIENYIWNITYAGNPDGCNICTMRKNALETAYGWRKKMSLASISSIQSECKKLMNTLGYRLFHSDSQRRDNRLSPKY